MKRIINALLAVASLVALVVLAPVAKKSVPSLPVVHAQSGCNLGTLTGNYAFILPAGLTTPSKTVQGNEVAQQAVGVLNFGVGGNVSVSYTVAINGDVFTNQTGSGTYAVNSSCTGSATFTAGDAAGSDVNLVILGGGTEVFGIFTNAGSTASFVMVKQ